MKSLLLIVLTCLVFVGVFLALSVSLIIIAGMAAYGIGRRLAGLSLPVAS
ncbi:MAG TPA: hypothetical protein VGA96_15130 [Fibrella sp.]